MNEYREYAFIVRYAMLHLSFIIVDICYSLFFHTVFKDVKCLV